MATTQIQAYATYTRDNFDTLLERYRSALKDLGCHDQGVLQWLAELHWPQSEDDSFGDIYPAEFTLTPTASITLVCTGIDVALYPDIGAPTLEEEPASWIGINLQFESETLQEEIHSVYKSGIGGAIWHTLRTLAKAFPELGVYFTEEWQENRSWRSIVEEAGDPWAFELAIFPRKLAPFFESVPAGFDGTVTKEGFGFAQSNRWSIAPWTEAE
ncbi:hypothetical protein [Ktedonospora formicarum]|uniref:Uncharacterized protein n=1 Tax=Ktedonospora formicarum TaxID=2778364 RepID=A0A8J3HUJ9_9CHLR|nr:hypothetical protein [Ktedonospora formicarum]GHO44297.1 hypothetical protein KSX_24600 [Ktedonospora formicarum]